MTRRTRDRLRGATGDPQPGTVPRRVGPHVVGVRDPVGVGLGGVLRLRASAVGAGKGRVNVDSLGSRQVYANAWMTVREDPIRRADGSTGIYGVVDKPDFALVIPLDGERMRLVEQYRYPIGMRRWEFPQGTAPDRA